MEKINITAFIQDIETQKWNNVPLLITQYNNIITDFIDKIYWRYLKAYGFDLARRRYLKKW